MLQACQSKTVEGGEKHVQNKDEHSKPTCLHIIFYIIWWLEETGILKQGMHISFLQKTVQGLLSEFIISWYFNIFRASQNIEAWITIAPPWPGLSSLTLHRCSAWTITIAPRAGHPPVPGKTLGRVWKKMEKVCPSCPEEHKANLRDSVMKICTIRGAKH